MRTTDMPPADAPLPQNATPGRASRPDPEHRRRRSRHQRGRGKQLAAGARERLAVGIDPPRDRAPRHDAAAGARRGAGGRGQADRRAQLRRQLVLRQRRRRPPTRPITDALDDWRNSATRDHARPATPSPSSGPSAQAIVSTLDYVSDLRILSAPSVLVRNNVEADFNSGQQIPVASTDPQHGGNVQHRQHLQPGAVPPDRRQPEGEAADQQQRHGVHGDHPGRQLAER